MSIAAPQNLDDLLEHDEGRKRFLYKDSQGLLTIGVGYNIQENGLPDQIIDELYQIKRDEAIGTVRQLFGFTPDPTRARDSAIVDMAFELGEPRLRGFVQLRSCWEQQDWAGAAAAALDSQYARQVPNRAREIAKLIETDDWSSIPVAP